jgi:stress response protein YsnF
MKSAYELAMERLQKQSPEVKLSDAKRKQLGELDSLYKAKRAEREVFLRGEIAKAEAQGDGEAYAQLQKQLSHDLRRLEEELEAKKEKVRSGGR